MVDRVVVDVHIVVVVVVDVVVDVGHGIQGQQHKSHEVEGIEAKVANSASQIGIQIMLMMMMMTYNDGVGIAFTWASLPGLAQKELFLSKVLHRVQAHQLPVTMMIQL